MSYEDVDKVLNSGIEDGTLFNVLVALAFFNNDKSGLCYPSTKKISLASRRSQNVVRTAIQRLEELGYVETKQIPGFSRYFDLHLDRLPKRLEPLKDLEEKKPLSKKEPLSEAKPLSEETVTPFQKCEEAPFEGERGPLSEVKAEKVIEKVREKVNGISGDRGEPAPARSNPKTSRRRSSTACPWEPGTPIPDDLLAWATANYPTIDARQEFQSLINSALAHGRRYVDWNAAFRTWMGNALKYRSQRGAYRGTRQPVDRSHFAHEKPMNQKDFSMSDQQLKDMEYIFALDAEEAAKSAG